MEEVRGTQRDQEITILLLKGKLYESIPWREWAQFQTTAIK